MPFVAPSNNFIWGLSKQPNEGSPAATEEYGTPVYSGRSMPVETLTNIAVTDASAMQGDSYKQGDQHWEADVVVPAFAPMLGRILTLLFPTDTVSGVGPFTHAYSGLGAATAWFTTYGTDLLGGTVEEMFEAGLGSGLTFSIDESGGPLRVGIRMVGKRPTIAPYTNAIVPVLGTDGYFTAKGATLKYEVDSAVPATELNIQNFAAVIDAPVMPVATAEGISVSYLSRGLYTPSFTMTLLMDDHEAYRATFYGAVGGSAPSAVIVYGSVEINFVHTVQAGWSFKLTIPKAVLAVSPPQPDPAASPLTVTVNGRADKPAAGSHIQPVLINAVAASYSA